MVLRGRPAVCSASTADGRQPAQSVDAIVDKLALVRSLDHISKIIAQANNLPPILCSIAVGEWATFDTCTDELQRFLRERCNDEPESAEVHILNEYQSCGAGSWFAVAACVVGDTQQEVILRARRLVRQICDLFNNLIGQLPDSDRQRLGIKESIQRVGVPGDWLRTIFQLAWHFPHHFHETIHRQRIHDYGTSNEDVLRLNSPAIELVDRFPGCIFSDINRGIDFLGA